ncbi:hypothetical protein WDW89_21745 [Deltaproteobacteria bacterium TL4]
MASSTYTIPEPEDGTITQSDIYLDPTILEHMLQETFTEIKGNDTDTIEELSFTVEDIEAVKTRQTSPFKFSKQLDTQITKIAKCSQTPFQNHLKKCLGTTFRVQFSGNEVLSFEQIQQQFPQSSYFSLVQFTESKKQWLLHIEPVLAEEWARTAYEQLLPFAKWIPSRGTDSHIFLHIGRLLKGYIQMYMKLWAPLHSLELKACYPTLSPNRCSFMPEDIALLQTFRVSSEVVDGKLQWVIPCSFLQNLEST